MRLAVGLRVRRVPPQKSIHEAIIIEELLFRYRETWSPYIYEY